MDHGRVTAVVWHRSTSPPEALVAALQRQSIPWESARGPFDATSRMLCKRGGRGRVLIVVSDDQLESTEDVRRTLERFDPVAGCWSFSAAPAPKLAPLPAAEPEPQPEVVIRPTGGAAPDLRLTGDVVPSAVAEPEEPTVEAEAAPRAVLTPDELAMLLEDEEDDR